MKKLLVASSNKHKLSEIEDILKINGCDIQIVSPEELGCKEEPDENGSTFEENAFIKADFYYQRYHLPTLADDSGICIDFFDGKPGIHSARFLPEMNYQQKCQYIIDQLKDSDNRGAQFVDCMCFIEVNGNVNYYKGINRGYIAKKIAGDKGFGYDPIFVIPEYNKTEAELGEEYKNRYSHRAIALKKWIIDAKDKL